MAGGEQNVGVFDPDAGLAGLVAGRSDRMLAEPRWTDEMNRTDLRGRGAWDVGRGRIDVERRPGCRWPGRAGLWLVAYGLWVVIEMCSPSTQVVLLLHCNK